tara:strand:+ start:373 stop:651 length:279 start_codon:yes stop_codon:yes gene_type:complete
MKSFLLFISIFILISACASSVQNIGSNKFRVSCGGMLNDWGTCYSAAKEQCATANRSVVEINRREVNQPGQYNTLCACTIYPVTRDLIFACS